GFPGLGGGPCIPSPRRRTTSGLILIPRLGRAFLTAAVWTDSGFAEAACGLATLRVSCPPPIFGTEGSFGVATVRTVFDSPTPGRKGQRTTLAMRSPNEARLGRSPTDTSSGVGTYGPSLVISPD